MRIYVDTASLAEIEEWNEHPWVSGFTTNPTLMRQVDHPMNIDLNRMTAMDWAKRVVELTDKPVSIDGPSEVWDLGPNVIRKVVSMDDVPTARNTPVNLTAVCSARHLPFLNWNDIISVFAGRIMDTGRDPVEVIEAAKETRAQVLWASVREPYNIVMAEDAGCDIVTVPPAILRKWLDWHGKPLEVVAAETIAQFEKDSEGLWT